MAKKKIVKKAVKKTAPVVKDLSEDSNGVSVISKAGGYAYEGEKNPNVGMGVKKNPYQNDMTPGE